LASKGRRGTYKAEGHRRGPLLLVRRLSLLVLPVERLSREGQGTTMSARIACNRRYSSMNRTDFGCLLSISMPWASDIGAGTSSLALVLGLYRCIVCIGTPLTVSLQALLTKRGFVLQRGQGLPFPDVGELVRGKIPRDDRRGREARMAKSKQVGSRPRRRGSGGMW
jgi:hypothetical protein